ncbi:MAG: hypothetical protein V3G42_09920 [Oscillospiraceae bacterium]
MGLFFNDPKPIVIYHPPEGNGFDKIVMIAIIGVVVAALASNSNSDDSSKQNSNSDSSYSDSAILPEGYTPQTVKLTDLEIYSTNNYDGAFQVVNSLEDNTGKSHSSAWGNRSFYGDKFNQYYLNNEYLEFSGTVFLTKKATYLEDKTIFVEFSGDGNPLGTFQLTTGTQPQDFLIDVTGVTILEIRATVPYVGWGNYVGIDATLKRPDPPAEEEPPAEEAPPENIEGEESPENDNHEAE